MKTNKKNQKKKDKKLEMRKCKNVHFNPKLNNLNHNSIYQIKKPLLLSDYIRLSNINQNKISSLKNKGLNKKSLKKSYHNALFNRN